MSSARGGGSGSVTVMVGDSHTLLIRVPASATAATRMTAITATGMPRYFSTSVYFTFVFTLL